MSKNVFYNFISSLVFLRDSNKKLKGLQETGRSML